MGDFEPTDPIVALCDFTKEGDTYPDDAIALGVDDCWVEVISELGRDRYVVHAQYVNRDGSQFYIGGDSRAEAEIYLRDLIQELGGLVNLSESEDSNGNPVWVPPSGAVKGTLRNPYTSLEQGDLYLVSAEHEDEGGRYYGVIFTFHHGVPVGTGGGTVGTADFTYDSIDIGNQPGKMETVVDQHFVRYVCTTRYNGSDLSTYIATLADAINLSQLTLLDVPRGITGNRGIIKSYTATNGPLTHVSKTETITEVYPEELEGTINDEGILDITATFVKER